jgi:hypothetical protein
LITVERVLITVETLVVVVESQLDAGVGPSIGGDTQCGAPVSRSIAVENESGAGVSAGVSVGGGAGAWNGVRARVRTLSNREVARRPAYITTRTSVPTTRFMVASSAAGIAPT